MAEDQQLLCDPFKLATNQVSLQAFNITIADYLDLKDFFTATVRFWNESTLFQRYDNLLHILTDYLEPKNVVQ